MFGVYTRFTYDRCMTSPENNGSFDFPPPKVYRLEDMMGESVLDYSEVEALHEEYPWTEIAPLSIEAEEILFEKSIGIQAFLDQVYSEIDKAFDEIGEYNQEPDLSPF